MRRGRKQQVECLRDVETRNETSGRHDAHA